MIYLELGSTKRVCINIEFRRAWLFSRSAIPCVIRPATGESGNVYMGFGFWLDVRRKELKEVSYRRADGQAFMWTREHNPHDAYERGGYRWELQQVGSPAISEPDHDLQWTEDQRDQLLELGQKPLVFNMINPLLVPQ